MDRTLERSTMRKVYLRLLPFAMLCLHSRLYRPHQCQLRRTHHARRHRHVGWHLRLRRRHVLLGLLHLRSAEQRDPGKDRRQDLDRPDHDHLGNPRGGDRLRDGFDELRDRALPARRRRGRILPRHHPLLHLLVSEPIITPASSSGFLVGLPVAVALGAPISTALLGLDGLFGLQRLAGDVHRRGDSDHRASASSPISCSRTVRSRRNSSPRRSATGWSPRSPAERRATEAVRRYTLWEALYNPKVLLLALNYLGIVTASLGMLILHSADHQVARQLQQHDGRLAHHDPLYLRRHRHGGVGAHLGSHERAALESVHRLRVLDRRPCHRRHDDGHLVGAGRNVDRRDGLLRLQGPVLRHAADVPQRRRRWRPALPGSTRSAISAASSGPGMSAS